MENKNEWKKVKLGDIGEIVSGGTPKHQLKNIGMEILVGLLQRTFLIKITNIGIKEKEI